MITTATIKLIVNHSTQFQRWSRAIYAAAVPVSRTFNYLKIYYTQESSQKEVAHHPSPPARDVYISGAMFSAADRCPYAFA